MGVQSGNNNLKFVYDLFTRFNADYLNYSYRGQFTQKITETILALVDSNIIGATEHALIKKKVYHIMVECLQNITRHQPRIAVDFCEKAGVFFVQSVGNRYFITSGNLIRSDEITQLKSRIDIINQLDPKELKNYYRKRLVNGELSPKGGAGLGLIDIARKSENKLLVDFQEVDDTFSFFYLQTEVLSGKKELKEIPVEISKSFKFLKKTHHDIIKNNIHFIFNKVFNQESLVHILTNLEIQIDNNIGLRNKMINILVEMLQNIVKHADNETDKGKPGIFILAETEADYTLLAGNYIKTDKVTYFQKRLKHVNSLSTKALGDFYDSQLMNFEDDDKEKSGLGLIDMRLKSTKTLEFNFSETDNDCTFFTLVAKVPKDI